MKLHRLELEGFGPFRERQVVDFDAFDQDGIFLIAGRTGAGKSSVLDGVCFALYGGVPRYDSGDKRLRSDYCAPDDRTQVRVEFSSGGRTWAVTRSPEYQRAKKRGPGVTPVPATVRLEELTGGAWVGHSSGGRAVAAALEDVLGLSRQQFLQVILLAQNRFAQFLLADNEHRQTLLRRLFGTTVYQDYQAALDERRRESRQALASSVESVTLTLDEAEAMLREQELTDEQSEGAGATVAARIEAVERGALRARHRAETRAVDRQVADERHQRAAHAHAVATTLREKQGLRAQARVTLAAREAASAEIAERRAQLSRAIAAETVRAAIAATERAEDAAQSAQEAVDRVRVVWQEVGAGLEDAREHDASALDAPGNAPGAQSVREEPSCQQLQQTADRITGDVARWREVSQAERQLRILTERRDQDQLTAEDRRARIAQIDEQRAVLPDQLMGIQASIATSRERHGTLAEATARAEQAQQWLRAAREVEQLTPAMAAADAEHISVAQAHERAQHALTSLLRRRLAGHAGELAAQLLPGQPCAVCGSAEHPDPARPPDQPVTDDEVAAAESDRDAAACAESEAAGRARERRAQLAAVVALAAGVTAAEAEQLHASAEAAVQTAIDAGTQVAELQQQHDLLRATETGLAAEREQAGAELALLRESLAVAAAEIAATERAVSQARGGYGSVAQRIDAAEKVRQAALNFREALLADQAARLQHDQARADQEAQLAATDFADVAEASAALRDAETRDRLEERIREHEAAARLARERLRELEIELAGAPEDLVDLEPTRDAVVEAREEWSTAVDRASVAGLVAEQLTRAAERARALYHRVAVAEGEHAVVEQLADTVAGREPNTHRMNLESFVLAAELERIVAAANLRLGDMSEGRYRLQHTDARAGRGAASGLGIEVVDAYTGTARPARSLSGGETFLASLALALGLAEVVTARAGGVQLDTLFVDEGFGSLDDDTLELAMRTLDELRRGGRTVGVISHVQAMKDQLPAQLLVESTPHGPSRITQS